MSKNKVLVASCLTAILAELLLIFIIYFNPYKLDPIYNPELQVWINALMNGCSAICLATAIFFIKRGEKSKHIVMIHMALLFSALFLLNYIFYHMTVGHVVFQHPSLRTLYLMILAAHILVSVISLPFVFITYGLAITEHLAAHRKIAFATFLMWEFVSVSGVVIVLFLKFLNTGP